MDVNIDPHGEERYKLSNNIVELALGIDAIQLHPAEIALDRWRRSHVPRRGRRSLHVLPGLLKPLRPSTHKKRRPQEREQLASPPQPIAEIIQPLPAILEVRRPRHAAPRPREPSRQAGKRPSPPLILHMLTIEHGAPNPRGLAIRVPELHHLPGLNPAERKGKASPPQPPPLRHPKSLLLIPQLLLARYTLQEELFLLESF